MTRAFPDVTRPAVATPAGGIDAAVADVPGAAPAHGRHVEGTDPERAPDKAVQPPAAASSFCPKGGTEPRTLPVVHLLTSGGGLPAKGSVFLPHDAGACHGRRPRRPSRTAAPRHTDRGRAVLRGFPARARAARPGPLDRALRQPRSCHHRGNDHQSRPWATPGCGCYGAALGSPGLEGEEWVRVRPTCARASADQPPRPAARHGRV